MTAKKKTRNGPRPKVEADMRRKGYATVGALSEKYGVPQGTIYDWVHNDRIVSPDRRPTSVKYLGNVWVLEPAVKAKVRPPVGVAS